MTKDEMQKVVALNTPNYNAMAVILDAVDTYCEAAKSKGYWTDEDLENAFLAGRHYQRGESNGVSINNRPNFSNYLQSLKIKQQ